MFILVMRGRRGVLRLLVRYEVALWNVVDAALRLGEGQSGSASRAARIDRHARHARVQDLSDDIGITVGAASKFVDRLERDGLAVRRPNPANRRSSLLALTPGRARRPSTAAWDVCARRWPARSATRT